MEYIKDKAAQAKELAEKMLREKDIVGARRFAMHAQNLFSGLDGLSQLVEIIDVYVAYEKKIFGEVDWYGVLGVDRSADDETIRRQYRKLALALHPDKNKAVGAEGAFKILSEAWSVLSDNNNRAAYDLRCQVWVSYQKAGSGMPSMPTRNGFYNFTGNLSGVMIHPTGTNPILRPTPPSRNGFHSFFGNPSSVMNHSTATNPPLGPTPLPRNRFNSFTGNPSSVVNHTTATYPPLRPTPPPRNRFNSFSGNPSSVINRTTATNPPLQPTPPPPKRGSFWTSCNKCSMKFEFLINYINQYLLCPNCRQPFMATEVPPPVNRQMSSNPHHQRREMNNSNVDVSGAPGKRTPSAGMDSRATPISALNFQPCSFSKLGGAGSTTGGASSLRPASGYLKRGAEGSTKDAVSDVSAQNNRPTKKRRVDLGKSACNRNVPANQMTKGSGLRGNLSQDQESSLRGERTAVPGSKPKNVEGSQLNIRSTLMEIAKLEIRRKLTARNMAGSSESCPKEYKEKKTAIGATEISAAHGMKKAGKWNIENASQNYGVSASQVKAEAKATDFVTMAVPDPDFHDFDMDRMEKSFAENQVWAVYDDDDGMPRFYALVRGIISKKPFKMRISWLRSKTNTEIGPLDWVASGFTKTCGEFWIGKHLTASSINSFSHTVKWSKGARGVVQIFPSKGEIWALYKNWSPDWNELTPSDVIHQYDMVEVMEDYNELRGVVVAPLVKMAGFKSTFCQNKGAKITWTIARHELFRFSHQVPSYLLTGEEGESAPRGCLELDPAAMPLELLRVLQEDMVVETVEKSESSATVEGIAGERTSENAVDEAVPAGVNGSTDDVNPRFRGPILTYSRRKGKKATGKQ